MGLHNDEIGLEQIDFLLQRDIYFANTFCSLEELSEECAFYSDAKKIASYNNHEKGIIGKDFFLWALAANISYDAMRWFIEEFSGQGDDELLALTKAYYKKYRIYLDESNNSVKFKFKNDLGETNVSWFEDFVLAGVALDEKCEFDIDALFESFNLQNNITDAKLRHIAKFKGDEPDRLVNIIKSDKVKILLDALNNAEGVYIHWSTQNLWYYSIVDLVDSSLEIPFISDAVKNALFNHAVENSVFSGILAKYNYPNINDENTELFCSDIIGWINCLEPINEEEEFLLECLRQGVKSSKRLGTLVFLRDNSDRILIDNFIPNYALRLCAFPNSSLIYDECTAVQENIGKYARLYCSEKIPKYSFASSTNNRGIQLADMVSGLTGALMAYVNTHDKEQIYSDYKELSEIQHYNLKSLLQLRVKSSKHNMFFDNMSRNNMQIERIRYLMELEKIDYCCS